MFFAGKNWMPASAGMTIVLLALVLIGSKPAQAQPQYQVEPCCELCSRAGDPAAYTTKFLQSSKVLVQGKDGWLFRSEVDLRTRFGPDEHGHRELLRLRDALKRRGVDLVMVYQPPRGLMHKDKLPKAANASYAAKQAHASYSATLKRLRGLGIAVPPLDRLLGQKGEPDYFFRADHHWTPDGARRTAELVADTVSDLPSYKKLKRKQFVTKRTGVWDKSGTLHEVAERICGAGYADQWVNQYVTEADGEGDLLGDQGVPPVTLVGTSNSGSHYNFAGFLSEYLGVDILSFDVVGGGYDGALMSYLPTDEFQKTPPKILIWELAPYHNISKPQFYRQVVPLVGDGCRKKPAVLSRNVTLKPKGSTEALFNGGGQVLRLPGKHYQLDLQFSDPAVRELKAVVWYTNGSKETLSIEHSQYLDMPGRFVAELRTDGTNWGDRLFLSLDIHPAPGTPAGTSVSAKLCARDDAPKAVQRMASVK
jgi:alginate biosynthesis protein AlgX